MCRKNASTPFSFVSNRSLEMRARKFDDQECKLSAFFAHAGHSVSSSVVATLEKTSVNLPGVRD